MVHNMDYILHSGESLACYDYDCLLNEGSIRISD